MTKKSLFLLLISIFILSVSPIKAGISQSQRPDEAQIADYLKSHPLVTSSGAELLSVSILGEALVIDLTANILPSGTYDAEIFSQLEFDLDQALNINSYYMTTFKVEGHPLEFLGEPEPDIARATELPSIDEITNSGPLAGIKIALSPGHGLYWNETYEMWMYQRGEFFGIREDIVNAEIMRYLQAALINQGASVIQLRELDLNAGTGVTSYPTWHESAQLYAIAEGLPSTIYDGSTTNYNDDIRARPYMANYYGADVFISLHNNGWDGTLRGTETYWDINNHPGSYALANAVHTNIINTIRAEYDPDWIDRRLRSVDWAYGEIYFAEMPAALVELAFMDNPIDNSYLHDEAFKMLAAQAITQGICDFYSITCEKMPISLPQVLEKPTLTPAYDGGMCGSGWYSFTNLRGQTAYLALNVAEDDQSTHQASWQMALPSDGEYRVEAYIPDHRIIDWRCPDKSISWDTSHAHYQITHANGESHAFINQAPIANHWVDLGTYYFYQDDMATVTLTDVTGEPYQTTTVSASALRFTLVSKTDNPIYNTPWADASWLADEIDAPAEAIRNFLITHNSCLASPIYDSDGVLIDISELLHHAAETYHINPKLLLAIMESEQNALSQCPNSSALASLMGLDPPSTARGQINLAGEQISNAMAVLAVTGVTPNGWAKDSYQITSDGVLVVPASETIAVLFDGIPYVGTLWGGQMADENGVQGIYQAWLDYKLDAPLPRENLMYFLPLILK